MTGTLNDHLVATETAHGGEERIPLLPQTLTLAGAGTVEEQFCGLQLTLASTTFFQVNTTEAERAVLGLSQWLLSQAGPIAVIDAYCGIGTIPDERDAEHLDEVLRLVPVDAPGDPADLSAGPVGEGEREVLFDEPAADAQHIEGEVPDEGSHPARKRARQDPDEHAEQHEEPVSGLCHQLLEGLVSGAHQGD